MDRFKNEETVLSIGIYGVNPFWKVSCEKRDGYVHASRPLIIGSERHLSVALECAVALTCPVGVFASVRRPFALHPKDSLMAEYS